MIKYSRFYNNVCTECSRSTEKETARYLRVKEVTFQLNLKKQFSREKVLRFNMEKTHVKAYRLKGT